MSGGANRRVASTRASLQLRESVSRDDKAKRCTAAAVAASAPAPAPAAA